MGYVADIFDRSLLDELPGFAAVGHVRYATAGNSSLINAQPMVAKTHRGRVALAHNGNLVNARRLRHELERAGAIFQSTSDSEVFLHLLARSQAETLEAALLETLDAAVGAYSLAVLCDGRLFAARDPHGFRPLALGPARRHLGRGLRDLRVRPHRGAAGPRGRRGRGGGARGRGAAGGATARRPGRTRTASSSTCTSPVRTRASSARTSGR